jgi:hypothetical protein
MRRVRRQDFIGRRHLFRLFHASRRTDARAGHTATSAHNSRTGRHVRWSAAAYAGIAAGIAATIVEIALWSAFTDALPQIFFRDARFAAAIVMGAAVLSPTAGSTWQVLLAATLVHVVLSVAYGLILSWLILRMRMRASLLAGAAFGLFVFALDMYGLTTVFPWFEASRDWITVAAHITFGMVAAGVYRVLTRDPPQTAGDRHRG